jgi:hypothetical protein
MEQVMLSRSALSFPITMVTFWLDSIAPRRAPRAWARKPRKEFLGTAMLWVIGTKAKTGAESTRGG